MTTSRSASGKRRAGSSGSASWDPEHNTQKSGNVLEGIEKPTLRRNPRRAAAVRAERLLALSGALKSPAVESPTVESPAIETRVEIAATDSVTEDSLARSPFVGKPPSITITSVVSPEDMSVSHELPGSQGSAIEDEDQPSGAALPVSVSGLPKDWTANPDPSRSEFQKSPVTIADARSRSVEADGRVVYGFSGPPFIASYMPTQLSSDHAFDNQSHDSQIWEAHPSETTVDVSWTSPDGQGDSWESKTTFPRILPDGRTQPASYIESSEDLLPPFDVLCQFERNRETPRGLAIDFSTVGKSGHTLQMVNQAQNPSVPEAVNITEAANIERSQTLMPPTYMHNELREGSVLHQLFPDNATIKVAWTPPTWDGTGSGQSWTKKITFTPVIHDQGIAAASTITEDNHTYVPEEIVWEFHDRMADRLPEQHPLALRIQTRQPIPWVFRGHFLDLSDLPSPGHRSEGPDSQRCESVAGYATMLPVSSYEERFVKHSKPSFDQPL